jgi:short-subunit dehydrogenase
MPSPNDVLRNFSAVIVTGGSSGIGKSFIERGANLNPGLLFCNLSRRDPERINTQIRLNHFPCDLSRPADIDRASGEIQAALAEAAPTGKILLINNSGFGAYGPFPEPNLEHQLEMIDVNIRGLVHLTGRLLPLLRQRGGAILNVASTAAFQPTPVMATYGSTKAFVLHWSLALREELRDAGVHVMAVCPGPTSSEFFKRAGLRKGTVSNSLSMSSDEVADEAYTALAHGRGQFVNGWKNWIAVVFSARIPKPLAAWVTARVLERYRRHRESA